MPLSYLRPKSKNKCNVYGLFHTIYIFKEADFSLLLLAIFLRFIYSLYCLGDVRQSSEYTTRNSLVTSIFGQSFLLVLLKVNIEQDCVL